MIISVIGLGLIGGSFCKTIKKKTKHTCLGFDINQSVMDMALNSNVIDGIANNLADADITIICLYPDTTISFLKENADKFKKGSIVIDTCGIKKAITDAVTAPLNENGICFIGAHPMAGREFSGFEYSLDYLFDNASLILTPEKSTPPNKLDIIKKFTKELNFKKIVISTPEEHDTVIAYTSQLAHVVSNAYVKSPTLLKESGFSAGSFKDLTRVAKLNEDMWTTLFIMNKNPLLYEIDAIINNLTQYKNALENNDNNTLKNLLRDGRILKEKSLKIDNQN